MELTIESAIIGVLGGLGTGVILEIFHYFRERKQAKDEVYMNKKIKFYEKILGNLMYLQNHVIRLIKIKENISNITNSKVKKEMEKLTHKEIEEILKRISYIDVAKTKMFLYKPSKDVETKLIFTYLNILQLENKLENLPKEKLAKFRTALIHEIESLAKVMEKDLTI